MNLRTLTQPIRDYARSHSTFSKLSTAFLHPSLSHGWNRKTSGRGKREEKRRKEFSHFPAKTNGSWEGRKAERTLAQTYICDAHSIWAEFGIQSFNTKYRKDTNVAEYKRD